MEIVAKLPSELKEIVWSYVDNNTKVWVSKYYYEKYHNLLILKNIPDFNKYIISLIIKNDNYIFDIIYNNMRKSWCRSTSILYGNQTFLTYEALLKYKALKYKNQHIFELIKDKQGKKQSKDIKKKILGWRN
tara:strand:+ start:1476 stop:1871 length:396 start_codon:yes stop_codon:yes gene_type:complete